VYLFWVKTLAILLDVTLHITTCLLLLVRYIQKIRVKLVALSSFVRKTQPQTTYFCSWLNEYKYNVKGLHSSFNQVVTVQYWLWYREPHVRIFHVNWWWRQRKCLSNLKIKFGRVHCTVRQSRTIYFTPCFILFDWRHLLHMTKSWGKEVERSSDFTSIKGQVRYRIVFSSFFHNSILCSIRAFANNSHTILHFGFLGSAMGTGLGTGTGLRFGLGFEFECPISKIQINHYWLILDQRYPILTIYCMT